MRRLSRVVLALVVLCAAVPTAQVSAQEEAVRALLADANDAFRRGDYDDASTYFDKAIASDSSAVDAAAFAKRASIFVRGKKYQQGLDWIRQVAAPIRPDAPLILEQEALLLAQLDRTEDAVRVAERVVTARPEAYGLQIMIGAHYFATEHEKSISAFERFLEARPDSASGSDKVVQIKLGALYLRSANPRKAVDVFRASLLSKGNKGLDAVAQRGLCAALASAEQWRDALRSCAQVVDVKRPSHTSSRALFHLARARHRLGQQSAAIALADKYCEIRSTDLGCYVLRADILIAQKRWRAAERELLRAEPLAAHSGSVLHRLGRLYLDQRNSSPAKAVETLVRAFTVLPDDLDVIVDLTRAYLAAGMNAEAAATADNGLTRVQTGSKEHVRLLVTKGDALARLGSDLTAAHVAYARALELDQGSRAARDGVIHSLNRLAAARFAGGALAQALQLLHQARDVDTTSRTTRINLAVLNLRLGADAEVIAGLSPHLEEVHGDALAHRLIAAAYSRSQEPERAASHYEKAAVAAQGKESLRPLLAEINTEWGGLALRSGHLDRAIAMLEAVVTTGSDPALIEAARGDLEAAYCRRGYGHLLGKRYGKAIADLKRPSTTAAPLRPETEPCVFALAAAYLGAGRAASARTLLTPLEQAGTDKSWLREDARAFTLEYLGLYAMYADERTTEASLTHASRQLRRLLPKVEGEAQLKVRTLLRATYEQIAALQLRKDKFGDARRSLAMAAQYVGAGEGASQLHNLAALRMAESPEQARRELELLARDVPEAMINLGIVYDRGGESRKAYEMWVAAQQAGARGKFLEEWIKTKRRIFGF